MRQKDQIPPATWASYEALKKSHPADVNRLLMEEGLTVPQIVEKLGAKTNYGWNRVVSRINRQHDAQRT